jgi:hypothetical protein
MSFLNLEVLKRKPTKSRWIMTHVKLSKNMFLGQRNWKTNKNCNLYGLMKIWSNFNHSKVLIIKWLRFWKKRFLIWIYHFVLHHILNPSNKFEMWINIIFPFCDGLIRWPIYIYQFQKSITTNKWIFFINK